MVVVLGLTGCGSGGGDGGGGGLQTPAADISGVWNVTETTTTDNSCGDPAGHAFSYQVTVTQNGNNLTVVTDAGTFNGTISGNTISWTGSYPEGSSTVTINSMTLTLNANGTQFTGTVHWSWTDGVDSCSGTNQISGQKQSSAADISGVWNVTETITNVTETPTGTCGGPAPHAISYQVTVTQNGNSLTVVVNDVTFGVGTFNGTISGSTISWTGSYPDGGGTATINSMTLTLNASGTQFTGTATWSFTEGLDSCSGTSQITGTKA
jgi:hypothetical protein